MGYPSYTRGKGAFELTEAHGALSRMSKQINAMQQAIAGAGKGKGKNILIVGDILHSRVAISNLYLLNLLGANVKISCPLSLVPKDIEKLNVSVSDMTPIAKQFFFFSLVPFFFLVKLIRRNNVTYFTM